jgi:ubiquinone/menaquinone biosynthesis C-methylase UbiE
MMSIGSSKTSPFVKYRYVVGDAMAMPFPDD